MGQNFFVEMEQKVVEILFNSYEESKQTLRRFSSKKIGVFSPFLGEKKIKQDNPERMTCFMTRALR